jgi:ubiquitin fusion degradation protein 1
MFFNSNNFAPQTFARQYRAYSGEFIGKSHLDDGGKIILPPSALDELSRMHITYPMLFLLTSRTNGKTNCGVLEFSGDEGKVYVPFWMMNHLRINPGDIITVKNVTLAKGTYVKIRPQQKAFIELYDPKAVLEKQLRNFSCLTKGDTILINYNKNNYPIDILEVGIRNANDCNEISIVETDVRVEFDRPLDMPEDLPEKQEEVKPIKPEIKEEKKVEEKKGEEKKDDGFQPFVGSGKRVDGKPLRNKPESPTPVKKDEKGNEFVAFGGMGQKLSQKKIEVNPAPKVEEKKEKDDFAPFKGLGRTTSTKKLDPTTKKEEEEPTTPKTAPASGYFIPFQGGGKTLK